MTVPSVVWFRQDLRLGGASRWWLHRSLAALSDSLAATGARLTLRRGCAALAAFETIETAPAG